jgi:inner membrane protein
MTALNHVAGGTVFTGLFSSLIFGINILASPWTIAAAVISSLLPDIDHTRSTIGKMVYPVARWLNRKYGHRTLTHGLPFMAGFVLVCGLVERTLTVSVRPTPSIPTKN